MGKLFLLILKVSDKDHILVSGCLKTKQLMATMYKNPKVVGNVDFLLDIDLPRYTPFKVLRGHR